jgi:phage terminase small subunit
MAKLITPKQKRFCEIYAGSGNATQAAKLAGYSEKGSQQIGAENLSKLVVTEYLAELTSITTSNNIATAVQRQQWWTSVMLDDTIGISERLRASEILARAQGDFTTKVTVANELESLSDDELDERIRILTAELSIN